MKLKLWKYTTRQLAIMDMEDKPMSMVDRVRLAISEWWEYNWLLSRLKDVKYGIKNLILRRDLIRTKLGKTQYHDKPELMLHGMMELIVDLVEKEKCFEHIDFDAGTQWSEAGEDIKRVYYWWKDYPNRKQEIDVSLDAWYTYHSGNGTLDFLESLNGIANRTDEEEKVIEHYSQMHDFLERKLAQEEDDMLNTVVKVRKFMWT